MSIFKLTKTYRNATDVYYVKATEPPDEDLLELIGNATEGGHHYGYKIEEEEVLYVPTGHNLSSQLQKIVDGYELAYDIVGPRVEK